MIDGKHISPRHVFDEHVVFLLFAVPVDAYAIVIEEAFGKDSDHPGFSIGVLARAIDVAVAQRGIGQPVRLLPVA